MTFVSSQVRLIHQNLLNAYYVSLSTLGALLATTIQCKRNHSNKKAFKNSYFKQPTILRIGKAKRKLLSSSDQFQAVSKCLWRYHSHHLNVLQVVIGREH